MKKLLVALGIAALSTGAMAQTWNFEKTIGYGKSQSFSDRQGNFWYRNSDNTVSKADRNGNLISTWGAGILQTGGQGNSGIGTYGRDGNIYIKDNDVVRKFDSNGTYLSSFGAGEFGGFGGIATNSLNEVYVEDEYSHRIRVYDTSGNFKRQFGTFGTSGQGTFAYPAGIAIDNQDRVYIVENALHNPTERVQVFDSSGNFLFQFGKEGSAPGEFLSPDQITVDNDGWIYVAEHYNHRISVFDNSGSFITFIGNGYGSADGQFDFAGPISVLDDKTIIVDNIRNGRLDMFKFSNPNNPGNNAVPEPSEWAAMGLLGTGLLGLVVRGRKKKLAN